MDLVINRLSEIEAAAVRYIEHAESEKKELEKQMKEHISAYDKEVDERTENELLNLKQRLDQEMQTELQRLEEKTDRVISEIQKDYKVNHTQLARKIFNKMIEEQ